ncbi:MAG: HNH endonuclease [Rhizobiaceae bacterium]
MRAAAANKMAARPRNKSLYSTPTWKKIRERQLHVEPFCRMCAREGVRTPAMICDHVERHGYDLKKFFGGPFQSLCKHHHDSHKQRHEVRGYSDEISSDGLPVDPNHPFNR